MHEDRTLESEQTPEACGTDAHHGNLGVIELTVEEESGGTEMADAVDIDNGDMI